MIITPYKNNNTFKAKKNSNNSIRKYSSANSSSSNKHMALGAAVGVGLVGILAAVLTKKTSAIKSKSGETLLNSKQIKIFTNQMKEFTSDIDYRKDLLKAVGMKSENHAILRPIVGPEEYKNILKNFDDSPVYYSPGKSLISEMKDGFGMSGKDAGTFRATMHMHTTHSDGKISVQKLLEQSVKYADEVADKLKKQSNAKAKHAPFTVAITDHDTTEGCKEAINIISSAPWKYRNLRVVLGCEISTKNQLIPQKLKKPINTHMLVHSINPFDKDLNALLSKRDPELSVGMGFVDMGESIEVVKKQKYGYMGIAHPGLTNIGESLENPSESVRGMEDLFKNFKEKGGNKALFVENHYHYYGKEISEQSIEWRKNLEKYSKNAGLYSSGGLDSHGKSIFYSGK